MLRNTFIPNMPMIHRYNNVLFETNLKMLNAYSLISQEQGKFMIWIYISNIFLFLLITIVWIFGTTSSLCGVSCHREKRNLYTQITTLDLELRTMNY